MIGAVQWNLRIKDKLVHRLMSTIQRLSFIGEFLPNILDYVTYWAEYYNYYYTLSQCGYMIYDLVCVIPTAKESFV